MKKAALIFPLCFVLALCSCGKPMKLFTGSDAVPTYAEFPAGTEVIVMNKSSVRIHRGDCRYATKIPAENRIITEYKYIDYFLERGYNKCKVCFTEITDESNIPED